MTDYEALKLLGHTPAKAQEIILDAKRGDKFSQQYLDWAKRRTETPVWIIVFCPLILIFLACLAFGPGDVSAAFEALFQGAAWVVAVWVAVLEAV